MLKNWVTILSVKSKWVTEQNHVFDDIFFFTLTFLVIASFELNLWFGVMINSN